MASDPSSAAFFIVGALIIPESNITLKNIAINKSIQKYRQLSSGSVEEAVIFIQTQDGITKYVLPDEVIDEAGDPDSMTLKKHQAASHE